MIAEIIETLEVTRVRLRAAEADAEVVQWRVMVPAELTLQAVRNLFIRMYPRKGEIIHLLVCSSLMALPTVDDLEGPLAREINRYMGNRCYLRPRPDRAIPACVGNVVQRLRGTADTLRWLFPGRFRSRRSHTIQHERPTTPRRLGSSVHGVRVSLSVWPAN